MKKLFISVPMKGRSKEKIQASMDKMHKIAEVVFGEELEVIDSYALDSNYADKPIACLGESIKKIQDADYFIGTIYGPNKGCYIEREVADGYLPGHNIYLVPQEYVLSPEEPELDSENPRLDGEVANVPIIS